jgi:hypothetical protein
LQRLPAGVGGDLLLAAGRCSGFTTALHRTNVASEVCLIHHHSPPRAANPLASRGQLSPYRPQHHALFILRAEALRTLQGGAEPLRVSLSDRRCVVALRCFLPAFVLLRSLMSSLRRPPRGTSPPQRFLFTSPGISSGTEPNEVCSPAICTFAAGILRPNATGHMPALISC